MRRSGGRVTPPPDSMTTRTMNRGGGLGTNERVLPVARDGGRDRRRGALVRVAAEPHGARAARLERAPPGRGGGRVPRLYTGVGFRADRGHGVFGLRMSVLRLLRDGADAGDSRAAARLGETAVAVSRFSAALPQVLPLWGDGRSVRGRAGQVLGDARPTVHQPPVGPDGEKPPSVFRDFAKATGLDLDKYDACMDGQRDAARLDASVQEGEGLGVRGTPSFFVNGRPYTGRGTSDD